MCFPRWRVFNALRRCWAHANISQKRKLELYRAIVLPKLLYNLESIWLLAADRKRLDSFHVRCLRRICKIMPSFISRVSNQQVLITAHEHPLGEVLRERQVKLYTSVMLLGEDSFLRRLICEAGTDLPKKADRGLHDD